MFLATDPHIDATANECRLEPAFVLLPLAHTALQHVWREVLILCKDDREDGVYWGYSRLTETGMFVDQNIEMYRHLMLHDFDFTGVPLIQRVALTQQQHVVVQGMNANRLRPASVPEGHSVFWLQERPGLNSEEEKAAIVHYSNPERVIQ